MKTLYLDCESGISGDMIVGALLDLGADEQLMRKALEGLGGEGVKIVTERVIKNAVDCCNFDVILDEEHDNHDHDMEYLFGHGTLGTGVEDHHHEHDHEHDHEHHHEHDHEHDHDHHHEHDHEHDHHHDHHDHDHHHDHVHRNLADVNRIMDGMEMTSGARKLAGKVFDILAEAEGKAHGKDKNEVHFHEVGALDSIADIVAAAVCFDNLGIEKVVIPKICEGTGTIRCAHGILPIPVPAVMNIASACGLPISVTGRPVELITPTGAAFAAAVMTDNKLPETFVPLKVGLGAGKRAYERPSILRAVIFESDDERAGANTQVNTGSTESCGTSRGDMDTIWKLETNIDDSTGEQLGFVMELLLNSGAKDAFYTPVYMKKNRPAWLLTVICDEDLIGRIEDIIFENTTTIGIRRQEMQRTVLPRKNVTVSTQYGDVEVKICTHNGREKIYPEYESAADIARRKGISIISVYDKAIDAYLGK